MSYFVSNATKDINARLFDSNRQKWAKFSAIRSRMQ